MMMGKESYQISETNLKNRRIVASDESDPVEVTEEDIKTVMDQTGSSEEEALQALGDTNGNIAEAIILLAAEKGRIVVAFRTSVLFVHHTFHFFLIHLRLQVCVYLFCSSLPYYR